MFSLIHLVVINSLLVGFCLKIKFLQRRWIGLAFVSNLIEIKKRIASISSTIKVTKVMHMIATSKIAKIKQKIVAVDKYNDNANQVMKLYLKYTLDRQEVEKYMLKTKKQSETYQGAVEEVFKKKLYILFSSDKGTCGAVNTNLFKEMINILEQDKKCGCQVTILPIGKKANQFVQSNNGKLGFNVAVLDNIVCAESFDSKVIGKLVEKMVDAYDNNEFDSIELVYQKYKNIITCYPLKQMVLPFSQDGLLNDSEKKEDDFINIDEAEGTIRSIVEFFVKTKLQVAYVSNLASIFSSRMNAMDNATKNGQEIIDELLIKYNKGRQAHITSELSDIVSGFEAIS